MTMGFEDFESIFGEPKAEWAKNSELGGRCAPLRRFLMHVFAPDYYHLKIQATDYNSITFEATKSLSQLEDMRDGIGIGGSWSEFVDYLVSSLKAEDIKLVVEKQSGADDALSARLVCQKAKGMPLISISLRRVLDCDANDVMANISFGIFKALKCSPKMMLKGEGYSSHLLKGVATDKENNENVGKRQKLGQNAPDKGLVSSVASHGSQNSPDKQAARVNATPKKASKRVVPAHRRTRVRGALIGDADDDQES